MGLRSESQQEIYPEIYKTPQEVKVNPSNADKNNLQPDRFGDMSSGEFNALSKEVDESSKKPAEKFEEPLGINRKAYRAYMEGYYGAELIEAEQKLRSRTSRINFD
jgi:hypothetical protein